MTIATVTRTLVLALTALFTQYRWSQRAVIYADLHGPSSKNVLEVNCSCQWQPVMHHMHALHSDDTRAMQARLREGSATLE